ncbi:MAG: SbcC/MukB-like Walker B domain-containing protein, partial [Acetobacteraceae bacterium]
LKLREWVGRTDDLDAATNKYATALAAFWPTLRHWRTVEENLAQIRVRADSARGEHGIRMQRRQEAANEAAAATSQFKTLQEVHGETVAAIVERHRRAEQNSHDLARQLRDVDESRVQAAADHSRAESDKSAAETQRSDREFVRRSAISALQQLAERRILADAHPSLCDTRMDDWNPAQSIDFVRHRIDAALEGVADDDASWMRRQNTIHERFQDLRDRLVQQGYQPEAQQIEEIVVIVCLYQGRQHTMSELHDAFATEIAERGRLLKEQEKEAIENHLIAEAAAELVTLVRAAEEWRGKANAELEKRPTSTGVRFRFRWEANPDIGFEKVRASFLRKGELWSPAERSTVADFLQGRIGAEQAADESASWRDHLARALDYRRWHRFFVERQQDGKWSRMTKVTYGTGSGGEKALALTLPRFAAAAAHYQSAPTAPRLIMLDEAFAGIDPTMRAQCMGVLSQFDLDVMMT